MSKQSFSGRRNSSRRAFLRGVGGVALGLPLLEFTHGKAWAASGSGFAKRFVAVVGLGGETVSIHTKGSRGQEREVEPGGGAWAQVDHWLPKAGSRFGEAHEIFEGSPIWDKMTVLRGVDNNAAFKQHEYTGGHWMNNLLSLTGSGFTNHTGDTDGRATGASIDYVVAQRLAARFPGTRKTPFNLLIPPWSYGCPFVWGDANSGYNVQEGDTNPLSAFNSIFTGVTSSGGPDPVAVARQAKRQSVLNVVMEGYKEFQKRLGTADRRVLEAHLDGLSSLEQEIQGVVPSMGCTVPAAPGKVSGFDDWGANDNAITETHAPLMAKLIVAAMSCGLTNVASLQIGDFTTPWLYKSDKSNDVSNIHDHSGHGLAKMLSAEDLVGNPSVKARWIAEMKDNRRFRMSLVKAIADGLDAVAEGDGTMLDNSLMLYTSEFSSGGAHVSRDVPSLLIGGAGGYLKTGQFVDMNLKRRADPTYMGYNSTATTNNLFTTILNAVGESDTDFGGPYAFKAGPISELVK